MAQGKTVGPDRGREEHLFTSRQNSRAWERVGAEPSPRDSSRRDSGGIPRVSPKAHVGQLSRELLPCLVLFLKYNLGRLQSNARKWGPCLPLGAGSQEIALFLGFLLPHRLF